MHLSIKILFKKLCRVYHLFINLTFNNFLLLCQDNNYLYLLKLQILLWHFYKQNVPKIDFIEIWKNTKPRLWLCLNLTVLDLKLQ